MTIDPAILQGLRDNTLLELNLEAKSPFLEQVRGPNGALDAVRLLPLFINHPEPGVVSLEARLTALMADTLFEAFKPPLSDGIKKVEIISGQSINREEIYEDFVARMHARHPGVEVVKMRKRASMHGRQHELMLESPLSEEDVWALAHVLKANSSLRVLQISGLHCSYPAYTSLFHALTCHPSLTTVNIGDYTASGAKNGTKKKYDPFMENGSVKQMQRFGFAGSKNILSYEPDNEAIQKVCLLNAEIAERLIKEMSQNAERLTKVQCEEIRDRVPSIITEGQMWGMAMENLAHMLRAASERARRYGVTITLPPDLQPESLIAARQRARHASFVQRIEEEGPPPGLNGHGSKH